MEWMRDTTWENGKEWRVEEKDWDEKKRVRWKRWQIPHHKGNIFSGRKTELVGKMSYRLNSQAFTEHHLNSNECTVRRPPYC